MHKPLLVRFTKAGSDSYRIKKCAAFPIAIGILKEAKAAALQSYPLPFGATVRTQVYTKVMIPTIGCIQP